MAITAYFYGGPKDGLSITVGEALREIYFACFPSGPQCRKYVYARRASPRLGTHVYYDYKGTAI